MRISDWSADVCSSDLQGLRAWSAIGDVPDAIDCAVVALPGDLVLDAVEQCAAKGIRALVIFSAGFNEAGDEGIARQARLREIVDSTGLRIVGPNCLGVFNSRNGAWPSFNSLFQETVAGPAIGRVSPQGGSTAPPVEN